MRLETDERAELCETLYAIIGSPSLLPMNGWDIFRQLIDASYDILNNFIVFVDQ